MRRVICAAMVLLLIAGAAMADATFSGTSWDMNAQEYAAALAELLGTYEPTVYDATIMPYYKSTSEMHAHITESYGVPLWSFVISNDGGYGLEGCAYKYIAGYAFGDDMKMCSARMVFEFDTEADAVRHANALRKYINGFGYKEPMETEQRLDGTWCCMWYGGGEAGTFVWWQRGYDGKYNVFLEYQRLNVQRELEALKK